MTCCNYVDGNCLVASNLAGQKVTAHESTCTACKSDPLPMQINNITKGLAIASLMVSRQPLPDGLVIQVMQGGPGTELRKLIEWFPIPQKRGCRSCKSLEQKMNRWGPDRCAEKIVYITKKLEIAAKRRGIPFSDFLAKKLIETAIRSSRGESS